MKIANVTDIEVICKDKKGRIVLRIIKDKVMVLRLPNMDEYTKKSLIYIYSKNTGTSIKKLGWLRKFLDFKSDDNKFCS